MNKIVLLLKIVAFSLLLYLEFGVSNEWPEKLLGNVLSQTRLVELVSVVAKFLLFVLGINVLVVILSAVYRRRKGLPKNKIDNVLVGLSNIYLLLMTGGIIAALLSLVGIDFRNLFTGLSIVAAAIAIITRDFIVNIISGIGISFSNEFTIGDYIRVGEQKGRVSDISISKVELLTDDDDVIFIPNITFFSQEITNHSKKGKRTVVNEFEISLDVLPSVEMLEEKLIESLTEYHEYIEENSFRLKVEAIKKDCVELKFQYTLKSVDRVINREIRKKTIRLLVSQIKNN